MRTLSFIVLSVLVGCGQDVTGSGGASGGAGGATGGSSGAGTGGSSGAGTGGSSGAGTGGSGGNNCGVETFQLQRQPPDVLIVQDKSGSMNDPPSTGGASKWSQVTSAIGGAVMSTQASIYWGITFFPSNSSCGTSTSPTVGVATNNYNAINSALGARSPGGSTPTAQAMLDAGNYLAGLNDGHSKYIVLATDGLPNCAGGVSGAADDAGAEMAISTVLSQGIHTFVIGISTDAMSDATLNQMAMNGGEARPTAPYYYLANNQADFSMAMASIAGQVVSCTFALSRVPPDPTLVSVQADGVDVPRDTTHMNGWDFGPGMTSIILYGTYCSRLQSGMIMNVSATFGCPPIGIHR
jgi:hypothetical protein